MCELLDEDAVGEVRRRGLDGADTVLNDVIAACPGDAAAPLAELAGVRFAEQRWRDASALADRALALDPSNRYAWDVLGSSRFMMDDLYRALAAWNHIGKPIIDRVAIEGLAHTRYALVADVLSLTPNTLLTEAQFRLASGG